MGLGLSIGPICGYCRLVSTNRLENPVIGLLGGGQLARMLALAGRPLGLDFHLLASSKNEPAAQVVPHLITGQVDRLNDLRRFSQSGITHATFESEFVDVRLLSKALTKGIKIFPNLRSIGTIQDRKTQKQLLDRFQIPTAEWSTLSSPTDVRNALMIHHEGVVLKARRNGYDGYGTWILRARDSQIPKPAMAAFKSPGLIAEKWIPFRRELAISFVRSGSGEFVALPLVETYQENSRCRWVKGPVPHRDLAKMTRRFHYLMERLKYIGVLSVEFFEVKERLLVNELAPRVHNSAHYSIDALGYSQFEYHLRAGLGEPLPHVELHRTGFAMVNLLGRSARTPKLIRHNRGHLHWYGKRENRPGRKMGHITALGKTPEQALKLALALEKGQRM